VFLYGGVLSVLFGLMVGFIDYYLQIYIGFSFSGLLFFLSSIQIGKMVRNQYEYPHIVYILFTGFSLVVQAFIIFFLPFVFSVVLEFESPLYVFDYTLYWVVLRGFLLSLVSGFNFNSWLTLLIYTIGVYLGVKQTY